MWAEWPMDKIALCAHITNRRGLARYLPDVTRTGPGSSIRDLFVPCQDVPGFCEICLTDFTTSIRWIDSVGDDSSGLWSIVITTYHQLGRCRSPRDWKWIAAGCCNRLGMPGFWRHRRSINEHDPGSVRRQWKAIDGLPKRAHDLRTEVRG